jgi:wyosine [tRNA(Phe)-imidazoG37] synthetase (radical SAM superfamily)
MTGLKRKNLFYSINKTMITHPKYRYLFGPVHSRRLGLSLGIDLVPMKTCTYSCIFCQLGRTMRQTITRKEYVPAAEVINELTEYLEHGGEADYLSFSGSGEPTLHSKLGLMIAQAKQISRIPVAVLTCGSLLFDARVRNELALADVVLPSLNAISPDTFRAINRPHGKLPIAWIIKGLTKFRGEYKGQLWLEIMLVKGMNDQPEEIAALRQTIADIKPDKVHLNTVVRPPTERGALPLTSAELNAIAEQLGPPAEVIADSATITKPPAEPHLLSEVVNLLARHPATMEQIVDYLHGQPEKILSALDSLVASGKIRIQDHQGKQYYSAESEMRVSNNHTLQGKGG